KFDSEEACQVIQVQQQGRPDEGTVKIHPAPITLLRRERQPETPIVAGTDYVAAVHSVSLPGPDNPTIIEFEVLLWTPLLSTPEGELVNLGASRLPELKF